MACILRLILLCLLLVLAANPFSQAFAASFTYEFVSGGLTGSWTTTPPDPLLHGGEAFMLSFHFTTPFGVVYALSWPPGNPDLYVHESSNNFGRGMDFLAWPIANELEYLEFFAYGPTYANPFMSFGTYRFETSAPGGSYAEGTGEWRLIDPVPVPAAFWLFGSGLAAIAGLTKRKRTA